jgi:pantoate--beta-alanine ligase
MSKISATTPRRYPQIAQTLTALRRKLTRWRARKDTVALVPTMGALHAGHLALVRLAQHRADRVVVSIFVNPTQFAAHEDLGTYPRTFAADVAALAALKADLVWAPAVETMYPSGFATRIVPEGPALATVVAKLLVQCAPDVAVFGEKDFQQLKVVTQLARDLDLSTRIVGGPTLREADGLAMSSRNRYLTPQQRAVAPVLYRTLADCAERIAAGRPVAATLRQGRVAIIKAGFVLDYLEARHAETLAPLQSISDGPLRLLVAARIGGTRLIDNVGV